MTLYLLDVASYQGALAAADVARAGFDAVNLKVSHGLTQKSVHPDIAGWITRARAAGLGIGTFHWLDDSATGTAQADYAHARLVDLGLADSAAHTVDTEADAPWDTIQAYVLRMTSLLARPVAIYSADWWWTAAGRGWPGADLTPYLWAAPNAGYIGAYPGDTSSHWTAGYGGWPALSVMQYAVEPLEFPDGTAGTINVSKSAIRDPQVWSALTGGGGMTYAPDSIKKARDLIHECLPDIPLVGLGIVGDTNHMAKRSSYHLGKSEVTSDSYSITESSRDRNGLSEASSAMDVGWQYSITVNGKVHNLRTFSVWLVAQCKAGTADTKDIREVIYTADGTTVKRWDRLGIRSTGTTSHLSHTHISWFRDSEGRDKSPVFRRYFTEIGLPEGDVSKQDVIDGLTEFFAVGKQADGTQTSKIGQDALGQGIPKLAGSAEKAPAWSVIRDLATGVKTLDARLGRAETALAAIGEKVDIDPTELDAIRAAAREGAASAGEGTVAAVVAAVKAALPPDVLDRADVVQAVEDGVTNVLRQAVDTPPA